MRHLGYVLILLLGLAVSGCGGAKLSVADEQMARGEYFDASKTYRKVYNKLTKKADRPLRGEIAFKMGECYRHLGMAARASAAYQNAIRYRNWLRQEVLVHGWRRKCVVNPPDMW